MLVASQPPPETDLHDGDVNRGISKHRVCEDRERLEVRQWWPTIGDRIAIHHVNERGNLIPRFENPLLGDRLPVQTDALARISEVGGGKESGTQPKGTQN